MAAEQGATSFSGRLKYFKYQENKKMFYLLAIL
jgi:hypothetical protein